MESFAKKYHLKYDICYSQFEFEKSIRELEDCFLLTNKDIKERIIVDFQNPSIQDFLISYFNTRNPILLDIIDTAVFINQLTKNFTTDSSVTRKINIDGEIKSKLAKKIVNDYELMNFSTIYVTSYVASNPNRNEKYWKKILKKAVLVMNH